jgi:hypothetical protein
MEPAGSGATWPQPRSGERGDARSKRPRRLRDRRSKDRQTRRRADEHFAMAVIVKVGAAVSGPMQMPDSGHG